ncbi:pantothenate synthetase [Sphingosinicella microcystinivorans]|uniref:Pantothenate synthetase n=1 Tax=Sphingosinicella microcystinivorans TaxID=335406 RepID=A0AAD1G0Z1_SPHMI|nr:pantothenate synthetase [Sphingosinicella microcystinivorans]
MALVPTMGALHAGHLALVAAGLARADRVVASIFVNPTQFGPNEDFSRYPRREAEDAAALGGAGCHLLFAPAVEEMYPAGFASSVQVAGLTAELDGAHRPGHFDGVATVVSKLLNQAGADFAMFGEKDYQQLLTVRRMAADLDIPTEIVGVPTVREADGLALSSRNAYLSAEERARAALFPKTLMAARDAIRAGAAVETVLAEAEAALRAAGFLPDYVALRDAETLLPVTALDRPARILSAIRLGSTRLIDNLAV